MDQINGLAVDIILFQQFAQEGGAELLAGVINIVADGGIHFQLVAFVGLFNVVVLMYILCRGFCAVNASHQPDFVGQTGIDRAVEIAALDIQIAHALRRAVAIAQHTAIAIIGCVKGAALDPHCTLVGKGIQCAVCQHTFCTIIDSKGTAVDGRFVPVQHGRAIGIREHTAVDGQHAEVVILNSVHATAELAGLDGQADACAVLLRFFLAAVIARVAVITVINGTGTCIVLDKVRAVHRQGTQVLDDIPCIAAKGTAVQRCRCARRIVERSLTAIVGDDFAFALHGQIAVVLNGMAAVAGDGVAIQIDGHSNTSIYIQISRHVVLQSDRAAVGDGRIQRILRVLAGLHRILVFFAAPLRLESVLVGSPYGLTGRFILSLVSSVVVCQCRGADRDSHHRCQCERNYLFNAGLFSHLRIPFVFLTI